MTKMMAALCERLEGCPSSLRTAAPGEACADLSALEWMVVELARHDRLSSIRPASMLRTLGVRLFGLKAANRLADPRLEALRRVAVYGWRRSGRMPDEEVDAFLAAGFSFDQMMLALSAIRARSA